tara:strand:- start:55457 stop:55951 length:495 start_codon:yes stop_codon:yes gene_type:complete
LQDIVDALALQDMETEHINWLTFQLDKYKSYFVLAALLLSICFPFSPPHNTFNLIENFHLPEIAYPISYVAIGIMFLLFMGSFKVSFTQTSKLSWNLNERTLTVGQSTYAIPSIQSPLILKSMDKYQDKDIWEVKLSQPIKRTFNIPLTRDQKELLQNMLLNID